VLLGKDRDASGKGSTASNDKQKGDGKASTSAPEAGRSYSSLLGGSSIVKVEEEATTEGGGVGSHFPEEKRLGPPQRGSGGGLYNPHGEKDVHFSSSPTEENHSFGPASRERDTGGRYPMAPSPPNQNGSSRNSNTAVTGTGAGMIHLNSYDDINRGERSSTAPRMLFDPKSGSMVEARQPQSQPPADFRGSKGGRGSKASKGSDRDRAVSSSGGGGKKGSKNESKERVGRNRRDSGADEPQQGDVVSTKCGKKGQRKPRAGSTGSKGDDSGADGPAHHPKKTGGRNAGNNKAGAKKQESLLKQPPSQARSGPRGRKDDRDASEDAGIESKRRGGRSNHHVADQSDGKRATSRDNKPLRGSPTKINGEPRNSRAGGLRSPSGNATPGRDGRRGGGRGGGRSNTTEMGGRGGGNGGRHSSHGQQPRHNTLQHGLSSHHSRFADAAANDRHSQPGQEQPSKPSLVFDSGGLSLPEVAPQFNDDDFKVITDITDSVPAGMASTDNVDSEPIKMSSASANAWQPSEAALAFAAVAAVKPPSKEQQDHDVHGGDADDDDDDDDDLLNVPFLGLGFDPARDMDAVMLSPSRQAKAAPNEGDEAVPALESLHLGPSKHSTTNSAGGSSGTNNNPFATVGSPGSQFLGSSTWGGGRTLQASSSGASGGTSGSNGGLNLNWNSILGGGGDDTALNGGSSLNSANGWGSSALRNTTLGGSIMLDQDAKD
jgi:hypothetical protein